MSTEKTTHQETFAYSYSDLVDIASFTRLLETFFKATGIPNGLVGVNGEIISQAGWVDACALFHRVNPETSRYCQESNLAIMHDLRDGQVVGGKCKNGLIDYATPVVIEGHQLATLFLGQVLHEAPDMAFFRQQAASVGFDEEEYLKAIQDVPVVDKARMEALMACMVEMAQMLAASGLARFRQVSLERDLDQVIERRVQLEDILDSSPVGIGWSDADGRIEYINHRFTQLFGYTLEDLPNLDAWYGLAYPDAQYRKAVVEPWGKEVSLAHQAGRTPPDLESNIVCRNGSVRRVMVRISYVGEKRLVNFSDITERWQVEQRNKAHDEMLEMVAKGYPLADILHAVVKAVEDEEPTSLSSVLLIDEEGRHLLNGAAPSLPGFYNEAIDGVEIGMGVGSCGTAAYLGERVVVEDIMSHEYWKPYVDLAQRAGLGACWSEPIFSSEGKVLGTFAIYHAIPTRPSQADLERISFAANLAAIAIENSQVREELKQRAYYDYLTGLANRRYFIERVESELSRMHRYGGELSVMMFDIDHFKLVNDTHGHKIGDLVLQEIASICRTTLRDIDVIGRFGGEEFTVLLPETGSAQAAEAAERLRVAIAKGHVMSQTKVPISFTASFGVVTVNGNTGVDELIVQADAALYKAKDAGRNRICIGGAAGALSLLDRPFGAGLH